MYNLVHHTIYCSSENELGSGYVVFVFNNECIERRGENGLRFKLVRHLCEPREMNPNIRVASAAVDGGCVISSSVLVSIEYSTEL